MQREAQTTVFLEYIKISCFLGLMAKKPKIGGVKKASNGAVAHEKNGNTKKVKIHF
jgi:hypothetical protein